MKKIAYQRLAVLVDAENIEIEARKVYNRLINYDAVFTAINGREVVRALYFKPRDCSVWLRNFLEKKLGVEVKLPPKNVDTWLTIDAITLAEKVDTIALVGGDADYIPLVWYLKSRGCKVEVWCWPSNTADDLKAAADEGVLLPPMAPVQNSVFCEPLLVAA